VGTEEGPNGIIFTNLIVKYPVSILWQLCYQRLDWGSAFEEFSAQILAEVIDILGL
jgi:hypothetical protein